MLHAFTENGIKHTKKKIIITFFSVYINTGSDPYGKRIKKQKYLNVSNSGRITQKLNTQSAITTYIQELHNYNGPVTSLVTLWD